MNKLLKLIALLLVFPAIGRAEEQEEKKGENRLGNRCPIDQIYDSNIGHGRNAWSFKCGYLAYESSVNILDAEGTYLTFADMIAPTDANAPCVGNLSRLGICSLGCFTDDQRLLFNGNMLSIEQAYEQNVDTITTLDANANLTHLILAEEPLASYVKGSHDSSIVIIQSENGGEIKVTPNHPMVDEQGYIVRADKLEIGQSLLTLNGPKKIISLETASYNGLVWNTRPKSNDALANINIAEGFLTGSIRFQNQWSNDLDRLYQRMSVNVSRL